MTRSEFHERVVEAMGKRPLWFELERDDPATELDTGAVESVLGVRLPQQYREFLMSYGGGPFAFLTVLGSRPGTAWELVALRRDTPVDFLPVADLGTGDCYGHRVVNGRFEARVVLWDHETASVRPTPYEDFYTLVADAGLRA